MAWLLRSGFVLMRRARFSNAGFVLPTVVMVILVVLLVTTTMVFRSFDRAKNASNVRVNQKVLAAASPAIDRAQAKINALLADPTLPRGTPSDQAIYQTMADSLSTYTLGDETPLKLVFDVDGNNSIEKGNTVPLDKQETLTTAWRFPVDTNNDGFYDTYSLYGLYFRNPTSSANRARSPLEARTIPMDLPKAGNDCGAGTAAGLVGNSGWYKTSDGNLKRSFFVFAVTVPITDPDPSKKEKKYSGNQGFAALEFQQDLARIPLTNNVIVYDDDLEMTPGAGITLNGRIMTNGNLLIGQSSNPIRLYQVSSIKSCFYTEENAKITVGGNVVLGSATGSTSLKNITVDLFASGAKPKSDSFAATNSSVTEAATKISYNSDAYASRINNLVKRTAVGNEPPQVKEKIGNGVDRDKALQDYFKERTRRVPFAEVSTGVTADALIGAAPPAQPGTNQMRPSTPAWIYPTDPKTGASLNKLTVRKNQPPATDPEKRNPDQEERLGDRILVGNGLPAKWWDEETKRFIDFYNQYPQPVDGKNNQVTKWDGPDAAYRTRMTQVVPLADVGDTSRDGFWERKSAAAPEQPLDGVGGLRVVTGAGVYFHDINLDPAKRASFLPTPSSPIADDPSTLENESLFPNPGAVANPPTDSFSRVVLPDSMPMWQDWTPGAPPVNQPNGKIEPVDKRGDLVMRATAVYHYRQSSYPDPLPKKGNPPYQKPIACVSSYYDPSTSRTAMNRETLPNIKRRESNRNLSPLPQVLPVDAGLSNNGVSYPPPSTTSQGITVGGYNPVTGLFAVPPVAYNPRSTTTLPIKLAAQANLIYPNGRFVNEPLRQALIKRTTGKKLNIADQGAIDSTICAIQIEAGTLIPKDDVIPHGAIYETAFLDARQVKALDETPIVAADYNLSIEERQPLEVRATVLDLDLLRRKPITGTSSPVPTPEYLLPDSGIIYATRDDALLDLSLDPKDPSLTGSVAEKMANRKIKSPVDFRLDPTRRPNGIMLINGSILARGGITNKWKEAGTEKGLILASNLPVYVKADKDGFNLHQKPNKQPVEEFTQKLASNPNWDDTYFYTSRTTLEEQFACRPGQPGLDKCTTGDLWRPATVIADSVTLLSNNFRFGFRNEGDYDLRKNVENLTNNLKFGGYDFNNNGESLPADDTVSEIRVGFDLNGNNNQIDPLVPESEITVTGARRLNGFFDNNYLTSADWNLPTSGVYSDFPKDYEPAPTAPGQQGSSYVNNFVTPIQRRTEFPEYVMEICRKPLVEECGPSDWMVGWEPANTPPAAVTNLAAKDEYRSKAGQIPAETIATKLLAGTTAQLPPRVADRRYPRRVAFLRNTENKLVLDSNRAPVPLGIDGPVSSRKVRFYSYSPSLTVPGSVTGATADITTREGAPPVLTGVKALWFKTTASSNAPTTNGNYGKNNPLFYQTALAVTTPASGGNPALGTTQQPLLVPVLQIHTPTGKPQDTPTFSNVLDGQAQDKNWMQEPIAKNTTFNLVIAAGDSPTRENGYLGAPLPEFNGGMPNFPSFQENWKRGGTGGANNEAITNISGSFIQIKRSAYATAPYLSILANNNAGGIFGYPQAYSIETSPVVSSSLGKGQGRSAYYYAPNRKWGFDVGLLSQLPDLFSQLITTPSAGEPNKFYREVSQDDPWVKTLLCAAAQTGKTPKGEFRYQAYAVADPKLRPTDKSQNPSGGCRPVPY